MAQAARDWGVGSGASRLVCGTQSPHLKLEEALAEFKRAEAALAYSTGFATALGTVVALVEKADVLILDKLCHACLIDAARMTGATLRVFPHNDLEKLENHLRWAREKHPQANVFVLAESIYSMDGDVAPLREMVELKERYGAFLLLDEAHALGVLGPAGRGLAAQFGLERRIELQMGTLSKALGGSGGYVCASREVVDLLINRARSFIYSTAPGPAQAATNLAALELLGGEEGDRRRETLWRHLRTVAEELQLAQPESAIVPVIIGDETQAVNRARHVLEEHGLLIPAIRYPTVARGSARLRITLSAAHTEEEVYRLTGALPGSD
jgi:8-amino-7-oxononanoate synthase